MSDDELFLAVLRLRIKRRRIECRMRQEDVAEKADIVLRTYQRYEGYGSKQTFNPTLRMLMRIAHALDTTVHTLTEDLAEEEIAALTTNDLQRVWRDGKLV